MFAPPSILQLLYVAQIPFLPDLGDAFRRPKYPGCRNLLSAFFLPKILVSMQFLVREMFAETTQ